MERSSSTGEDRKPELRSYGTGETLSSAMWGFSKSVAGGIMDLGKRFASPARTSGRQLDASMRGPMSVPRTRPKRSAFPEDNKENDIGQISEKRTFDEFNESGPTFASPIHRPLPLVMPLASARDRTHFPARNATRDGVVMSSAMGRTPRRRLGSVGFQSPMGRSAPGGGTKSITHTPRSTKRNLENIALKIDCMGLTPADKRKLARKLLNDGSVKKMTPIHECLFDDADDNGFDDLSDSEVLGGGVDILAATRVSQRGSFGGMRTSTIDRETGARRSCHRPAITLTRRSPAPRSLLGSSSKTWARSVPRARTTMSSLPMSRFTSIGRKRKRRDLIPDVEMSDCSPRRLLQMQRTDSYDTTDDNDIDDVDYSSRGGRISIEPRRKRARGMKATSPRGEMLHSLASQVKEVVRDAVREEIFEWVGTLRSGDTASERLRMAASAEHSSLGERRRRGLVSSLLQDEDTHHGFEKLADRMLEDRVLDKATAAAMTAIGGDKHKRQEEVDGVGDSEMSPSESLRSTPEANSKSKAGVISPVSVSKKKRASPSKSVEEEEEDDDSEDEEEEEGGADDSEADNDEDSDETPPVSYAMRVMQERYDRRYNEYKRRLQRIYKEHCPDKLEKVDVLCLKYHSKLRELYEKVCAKYGLRPHEDWDGSEHSEATRGAEVELSAATDTSAAAANTTTAKDLVQAEEKGIKKDGTAIKKVDSDAAAFKAPTTSFDWGNSATDASTSAASTKTDSTTATGCFDWAAPSSTTTAVTEKNNESAKMKKKTATDGVSGLGWGTSSSVWGAADKGGDSKKQDTSTDTAKKSTAAVSLWGNDTAEKERVGSGEPAKTGSSQKQEPSPGMLSFFPTAAADEKKESETKKKTETKSGGFNWDANTTSATTTTSVTATSKSSESASAWGSGWDNSNSTAEKKPKAKDTTAASSSGFSWDSTPATTGASKTTTSSSSASSTTWGSQWGASTGTGADTAVTGTTSTLGSSGANDWGAPTPNWANDSGTKAATTSAASDFGWSAGNSSTTTGPSTSSSSSSNPGWGAPSSGGPEASSGWGAPSTGGSGWEKPSATGSFSGGASTPGFGDTNSQFSFSKSTKDDSSLGFLSSGGGTGGPSHKRRSVVRGRRHR